MKSKKNEIKRNLEMMKDLLDKGSVTTLLGRAKSLRSIVEKSITRSKKYHIEGANKLHLRRILLSKFNNNKILVDKFIESSKKYKERNGGYTKIIKKSSEKGMQSCIFSLV